MKPTAVVFDMDGTIHDVRAVRHYVTGERPNFDAFHVASSFTPPNTDVVRIVHAAQRDGHTVIIVTARRASYRSITKAWLDKYSVPHDVLVMRNESDARPDADVKRDIISAIMRRYDIVHAVDDNPAVIAVWRESGVPVTVVPGFDGSIPIGTQVRVATPSFGEWPSASPIPSM